MKRFVQMILCCLFSSVLVGQNTFPLDGIHDEREGLYALTNATVHTHYNKQLANATLIIRDGKVESVGTGISVPKGAVVIDLNGKHIYPAFVDAYTNYGMPEVERPKRNWPQRAQNLSNKEGAYGWNQAIKPEFTAADHFTIDEKTAKDLRSLGFGSVLSHQKDGIARGSGVFVLLNEETEHEAILKDQASAHYSFRKGVSTQSNPNSLMGTIAIIRQSYLDADWYKKGGAKEEYNITLDHWNKIQGLPQIFESGNKLNTLRADKIGDEFGVQYIVRGSGDEYQRLDDIKSTGAKLILPLDFPAAYDVSDPYDAMNVTLSEMKHWELAPTNPAHLAKANIEFALTASGVKGKDFTDNLHKAIKHGLSKEMALKALTHTPANMLGVYGQVGSLERGKAANFLITSGELFEKGTQINENWVGGQQFVLKAWEIEDLRGNYDFKIADVSYTLKVEGKEASGAKAKVALTDSTGFDVKHNLSDNKLSLSFDTKEDSLQTEKLGGIGMVRLSGWLDSQSNNWKGTGKLANGTWINWSATKKADEPKEEKEEDKMAEKKPEKEQPAKLGEISYPFAPYGWTEQPKVETVLFQNATVWTNEADGILKETDVLIQNGKIASIGQGLKPPKGTKIVNAEGKHLTSGIVDEHSHIGISRGVNEGGQAITAEVRIGDVVNSEDVNIYRQLAGGVTSAQLLHGSANPIGGQSALVKLRWGQTPEAMKIAGADGFIKFALGENVKQSRSPSWLSNRYPQSRMGVEQVFVNGFTRAKEYEAAKRSGKLVRQDLELDALLEIINKQRFISCHSYVQSEITGLMRVAEQFNFRVNTFTHILEGYKVADKMKEHGVAASTFSDWWAYKNEVRDAIPHNGAILNDAGVLTGFNSDDA
ncbi:MAG: amidohydrolase, partial [Chitinophagales bacterium]